MNNKSKDKCTRGFAHVWKKYLETATHIVMKCERCKGKLWKCK